MTISNLRYILPLPLLLFLAGCGASIMQTPPVTPDFPDPTGNWIFGLTAQSPPGVFVINALSGSLHNSDGTISGVLTENAFFAAGCSNSSLPPGPLSQVTGTISKTGSMTFTFPIAQGIATIQLSLTPLTNTANGTLQIAGGSCSQMPFPLTAVHVPNLSGTYTGTVAQQEPVPVGVAPSIAITALLTQSDVPNPDGTFPLSGNIASTGACVVNLNFAGGIVSGTNLQTYLTGSILAYPPITFAGITFPNTSFQILKPSFLTVNTGCPGTNYIGSLTR